MENLIYQAEECAQALFFFVALPALASWGVVRGAWRMSSEEGCRPLQTPWVRFPLRIIALVLVAAAWIALAQLVAVRGIH